MTVESVSEARKITGWGRYARGVRGTTVLTGATVAALCVVAVLSAVIESFLVTIELVPAVSVASFVAFAGNVAITRAAGRTVGAAWAGFVPAVLWLLVVVTLGSQRPEGDLVLPGSWGTLLFMLSGTLGAVVGIASRDRPPPISPNGLSPERSSSA
jgi:hypothetical protein